MNKITIMGRLTKKPEMRYTQSNTPVASFSVAVDRDYDRDKVDFIDCVAWRKTGEFVSKYFDKGDMIALDGNLQSRDWTDKNGVKRTAWEINVGGVWFCGPKKDKKPDAVYVQYEELDEDGELSF